MKLTLLIINIVVWALLAVIAMIGVTCYIDPVTYWEKVTYYGCFFWVIAFWVFVLGVSSCGTTSSLIEYFYRKKS